MRADNTIKGDHVFPPRPQHSRSLAVIARSIANHPTSAVHLQAVVEFQLYELQLMPKAEMQNSSCDSLGGSISNVLHTITLLDVDKVQPKLRLTVN
jgi:hypothetical protein